MAQRAEGSNPFTHPSKCFLPMHTREADILDFLIALYLSLFVVLAFLLNFAGALCLLVGMVFTIPATCIANAYIYDQLLEHKGQGIVKA